MGNHDRPRVGSRFGEEKIDFMNTLVMTLPGIGFSYYGEEIGMLDNRDISWEDTQDPQACGHSEETFQEYTRDPVRTPFQWNDQLNAGFSNSLTGTWLPIHSNYKAVNLAHQKTQEKSHFSVFKQLTEVRKLPHFHGDFEMEVIANNVLCYKRSVEGTPGAVIVTLNTAASAQTVNLATLYEDLVNMYVEVSGVASAHHTG